MVDEYAIERDGGDIDSILDDFKTVVEWSRNKKLVKDENKNKDIDNTIINSISSLYKILEQESHNLRLKEKNSFISTLPDKIDKQLVFAQQIHIRATDLDKMKLFNDPENTFRQAKALSSTYCGPESRIRVH